MSRADTRRVTVGCGSGFARDKLAPAVDLAASGRVQYLGFDALAERTLAQAQLRRLESPTDGHDARTQRIVSALAPYVRDGLKVVGSFGAANVERALAITVASFREQGVRGVRIGAITGDDVLELVRAENPYVPRLNAHVSDLGDRLFSANCYLGSAPIVEALEGGAQWVIGGRISDASLFVAPICYEMGWSLDDYHRVAHATLAGHVLECSVQATGGYFADPPYRVVHRLSQLGYPIAEVAEDEITITKLPGSGGVVNEYTVGLQVTYEVHDPSAYLTPDVTADFTNVTCTQIGLDEVRVIGARGEPKPDALKVLLGVTIGYRAVGEISYAAAGCADRARLAADTIREAVSHMTGELDEVRYDLMGVNSLVGPTWSNGEPSEVRLRVAALCRTEASATALADEVECLYVHGPAGGGGVTRAVAPAFAVFPTSVDAASVTTHVEMVTT